MKTTTSMVHTSWPYYSNNRGNSSSIDTIPNVLRRDYIQYMLHWIALHRSEMHIAIVCHYHVIRAALLLSSSSSSSQTNNSSSSCSSSTKQKTNRISTPVTNRKVVSDIRPQNAEPIKCYLCIETGQITLASTIDKMVQDE
jgi:hypothetical protein